MKYKTEDLLKTMFDMSEWVSLHNKPEPGDFQQARTLDYWLSADGIKEIANKGGLRLGLGIHNGQRLNNRTAEDHNGWRTYMVEYDDGTTPAQVKPMIKALGIAPTAVIFTGGKSYHYLWVTDRAVDKAQWKSNQRALFKWFPGCDTQVDNPAVATRYPGSSHIKDGVVNKPAAILHLEARRLAYDVWFSTLGSPAPLDMGVEHNQEWDVSRERRYANDMRGTLAERTTDFLKHVNDVNELKGEWNDRLFKAAKDYQQQNYSEAEFLATYEAAKPHYGYVTASDAVTIANAFKSAPKYAMRVTNKGIRELVMGGQYYLDARDDNNTGRMLTDSNELLELSEKAFGAVRKGIVEQNKKDKKDVFVPGPVFAYFNYDPKKPRIIGATHGIPQLNTYNVPDWHSATEYQTNKDIPDIYKDFMIHLTGCDLASYEYAWDWIASSLRAHQLTFLTAQGDQGIGKGVLGSIISELHGEGNERKVRDQIFKDKFNGQLKDKTFIYIDEIALEKQEQIDRLKDLVNPYIEIDPKNQSPIYVPNYASYYLTTNRLDGLDIEGDDRRFSVINTTEVPLRRVPLIERIGRGEHMDEDNIARLGWALLNRDIKHDMREPFNSDKKEEIRKAGANDWEVSLIEWVETHPKGTRWEYQVARDIVLNTINPNWERKPGWKKVAAVVKRFPHIAKWIKTNNSFYIERL